MEIVVLLLNFFMITIDVFCSTETNAQKVHMLRLGDGVTGVNRKTEFHKEGQKLYLLDYEIATTDNYE